MTLPIQIPSGELINVDLEYEKLEKHCFACFSLFHEEKDCARKSPSGKPDPLAGRFNRSRTLDRLDADRRRQEDRRERRRSPVHKARREREYETARPQSHRYNSPPRRQFKASSQEPSSDNLSRNSFQAPLHRAYVAPSLEYQQQRPDDRPTQRMSEGVERKYHSSDKRITTTRESSDLGNYRKSQSSHTPPPRPLREPTSGASGRASGEVNSLRQERLSALERLSEPRVHDRLLDTRTPSGGSTRLQEVEVQYAERSNQNVFISSNEKRASGSDLLRLGGTKTTSHPPEDLPAAQGDDNAIVTEDRVPAVLRLGSPRVASRARKVKGKGILKVPKVTGGKRKSSRPSGSKRVAPSPSHGLGLKKRLGTRVQNPLRKRACLGEDKLVWLPEKSGMYSTKSGYDLAKVYLPVPCTLGSFGVCGKPGTSLFSKTNVSQKRKQSGKLKRMLPHAWLDSSVLVEWDGSLLMQMVLPLHKTRLTNVL
ncbi:unnamed protein product [Thlaspi arvense]|uniref:Zinc knuckle CX2CX4HX4C domain-containing protein n=1 Tax=Thlaspi arvense TaxID=13288 RepID=A0AAU9RUW6_THLAR|nr:unnamed protein product [Thlaspi arvense]